jgi:hypothetical protein
MRSRLLCGSRDGAEIYQTFATDERHHRLGVGSKKRQTSSKQPVAQIGLGGRSALTKACGGVIGNFGCPCGVTGDAVRRRLEANEITDQQAILLLRHPYFCHPKSLITVSTRSQIGAYSPRTWKSPLDRECVVGLRVVALVK